MNRRTTIPSVFAALLFSLSLSSVASAQSNDPWWGRNDDYRRERDRRDRDRRRNDDDYYDRGGYGNDRYGRYGDDRQLRDVAQRIKDRSRDLERDVDRLLDNSRINGTRREDHINNDAQELRRAADNFKSRVGNGRDLNRSANEARQLLGASDHVEQMLSRVRADSRTYSGWRALQQDLRYVADVYGINYNGGYNNRGSYDPRYPNDRYPDDRYPNDRNRRTNDGWWRRIPDVVNGRRP